MAKTPKNHGKEWTSTDKKQFNQLVKGNTQQASLLIS